MFFASSIEMSKDIEFADSGNILSILMLPGCLVSHRVLKLPLQTNLEVANALYVDIK